MLSLDGYRVAVIDRHRESFARLSKSFQGDAVKGVAFDMEALERAGIERADVFAAVTNYDNTNLMASEVARRIFGVDRIVARLYNPDKERTFQALDINYFCGTTILAERFMQRIVPGRLNAIAWTANNRVLLTEFVCPAHFGGRTVGWLEREELLRVGFIGRDGKMRVAEHGAALQKGDKVVAAVLAGRIARVRRMTGQGWPVPAPLRRAKARAVRAASRPVREKGG
jgi:trk system potassium uptake protein TrkA